MNPKQVVIVAVASCSALLLLSWLASDHTGSKAALQEPAPSKSSPMDVTTDLETRATERDERGPPAPSLEVPRDTKTAKELPTTASRPNELWNRTHEVSSALFNGTARTADVVELSKALLSGLDPKSASKRDDGIVEYRITEDPVMGTTKLLVNPSLTGKIGEFVIEVDARQVSGYNGNARDVEGSQLRISFGMVGDRDWGFNAGIDDNLRIRDETIWTENAHVGVFRIGGVLSSRGNDLSWKEKTAEAIKSPIDGTPAWSIGFGASREQIVEKGGFSGDRLEGIRSILSALPHQ